MVRVANGHQHEDNQRGNKIVTLKKKHVKADPRSRFENGKALYSPLFLFISIIKMRVTRYIYNIWLFIPMFIVEKEIHTLSVIMCR